MPTTTFHDDPSLAAFLHVAVPAAQVDALTGRYLRVNDAFCRLTGRTQDELLDLTYSDITHPDDREHDRLTFLGCLTQPEGRWTSEKRYVRPDGSVRWVVVLGIVMRREGLPWRTVAIMEDITARKEAELAARASEQRFRAAQDLSQQGFTVLRSVRGADGTIVDFEWTYVNPVAGRLLRRSPAALVGRRLLQELPANRESGLFEMYVRAVETGQPASLNLHYEADGIEGWFTNSTIKLEDGVAVSFWDITPLKRAEQELRNRVEELQTLMDTLPVAVYVAKDPECRVIVGNRAATEMVRQQPGANLSKTALVPDAVAHLRVCRDGEQLSVSEMPIQKAAALGVDVSNQSIEHVFEDGEVRHLFGHARPLFDETGRVRGAVGVYLDVTEQKRAEAQLRQAEQVREAQRQLLEKLIANVPLAIAVLEPATARHVLVNAAYQRITGRESSIVGLTLGEVLPGLAVPFAAVTERILSRREPVSMREQALDVAGDGAITWWNVETLPIFSENGQVEKILVIAQEISEEVRARTERERLLQEAREANRVKDEFLATLSHELRTPLNAMLGWSQLMLRNVDDRVRQHGLEAIARNALVQTRLVEDILDVSRIVDGRMALSMESVALTPIVQAAIDAVRPAAEAKRLTVTASFARHVRVNGDPRRLQQIFWNLLSNSVKFTDAGHIRVAIEADAHEVWIVVEDTGIGIDPAFLPHVFDRFTQADGSSTRQYGGLGLGLAIVRHLADLHGGRVSAASAGRNAGARFTVTLPRADHDEPRIEPARATAAAPPRRTGFSDGRLSGLRVLVVDDDLEELDLLQVILAAHGAQARTASSASEAFEAFRDEPFDLVISDIAMPDEDGYSLLRRIRALPAGGQVPAIALTAYARPSDRLAALAAGYQQHVAKPVSPDELVVVAASVARDTWPA